MGGLFYFCPVKRMKGSVKHYLAMSLGAILLGYKLTEAGDWNFLDYFVMIVAIGTIVAAFYSLRKDDDKN